MLRFLFAILVGLSAVARADIADYPFTIRVELVEDLPTFVAYNDGPATISYAARVEGNNIERNGDTIVQSVKPYSRQFVVDIRPQDAARPYRYGYRYSAAFGGLNVGVSAASLGRYPWNLQTAQVSQAPGGTVLTHHGAEHIHAVDFGLPEGTPILAAKAGVVVDVVSRYKEGGTDSRLMDKANVVRIEHADGTIASYAHLAYGNPYVIRGTRVNEGDIIGLAGNTGYSYGPHLHFTVGRAVLNKDMIDYESLPMQFRTPGRGFLSVRQGDIIEISGNQVAYTTLDARQRQSASLFANSPIDFWGRSEANANTGAATDKAARTQAVRVSKWLSLGAIVIIAAAVWRRRRR